MSAEKTAIKLNNVNLTKLGADVAVPKYDRSRVEQHIVHIGVGGFHRAHQAVYLDDLLAMSDTPRWGECGLGVLKSDDKMRDAMKSQDCLYTLVVRSADEQTARVIGSMVDYIYAPGDREAALEKMAAEGTKIVTLTITEGGYFIDDSTGAFITSHPDIQHDVKNPGAPVSSLGYIYEALRRRKERGIKPFTVMSCDNLQGNGHVIKRVLLQFASMIDTDVQKWIEANVSFPNCMVDRITPTTKPQDIAALRENFGVEDAWPVVTEPFIQWVIEDEFCNGRPQWERFDTVTMVHDVAPYEIMKMRLLNASHMAIAYLGALAGYPLVHEVMQDPLYTRFIERYMEEITPVVPKIEGVDLPLYKRTLIERFSNPTINDQVTRLCSEGSAKMPKWVIPSIAELLQQGKSTALLSLVIAAWIHYLRQGVDEQGHPLDIIDARKEELMAIAKTVKDDPTPMLAIENIYGAELPKNPLFVKQVTDALAVIAQKGVKTAMKEYLAANA